VRVAALVNCLGPGSDVRRSVNPITRNLLAAGLATPSPLGLGLATDNTGTLPGWQGRLWVVGPLRRGQLWEITAIPEIRKQAAAVAEAVVARPRQAERDTKGRADRTVSVENPIASDNPRTQKRTARRPLLLSHSAPSRPRVERRSMSRLLCGNPPKLVPDHPGGDDVWCRHESAPIFAS
jgi:hypothetical protein